MTLRSAYNDVFFQLQKEKELSDMKLREHTHSIEELRKQKSENERLTAKLGKLQNDMSALRNRLKMENVDLMKKNKLLEARIRQLQFGVEERGKFEMQQRGPDRKKELMPKKDNEFEVENILDDEFRNGKQYFLVKWKGYNDSENSWESKSNLNCPKILKQYFESK